MPHRLIMRGQSATGTTEVLNFSGRTPGYAYKIVQFEIFPSAGIGTANNEMSGCITAAKTTADPQAPNFDEPGLIANAIFQASSNPAYPNTSISLVNDMFIITQDLILKVVEAAAAATPINWQCAFEKIKLTNSAEAVANFNQFTIFDG